MSLASQALDVLGTPCDRLACPTCHLEFDRAFVRSQNTAFFSVIGAPSSGKSNFLGSMIGQLRRHLPADFDIRLADVDLEANAVVNGYEQDLFHQDDRARVALAKTATTGDLYQEVRVDGQPISYPRPFSFTWRTGKQHPSAHQTYLTVLYDNAGEHFYPGQTGLATQATRHLGRSSVLLFMFDPMQDASFRRLAREHSADPQLQRDIPSNVPQHVILGEAAKRLRRELKLQPHEQHAKPLLVCATKCDAWMPLLGDVDLTSNPWRSRQGHACSELDLSRVETVSDRLRGLLQQTSPELVHAAEDMCEQVRYIPLSALGTSPFEDDAGGLVVSAEKISPLWVTVPLLYALGKWSKGLVPTRKLGS